MGGRTWETTAGNACKREQLRFFRPKILQRERILGRNDPIAVTHELVFSVQGGTRVADPGLVGAVRGARDVVGSVGIFDVQDVERDRIDIGTIASHLYAAKKRL